MTSETVLSKLIINSEVKLFVFFLFGSYHARKMRVISLLMAGQRRAWAMPSYYAYICGVNFLVYLAIELGLLSISDPPPAVDDCCN